MKIGIVCYPTYGGSGVLATELGIGLAQKGHDIHFISYKRPARLVNYIPNVYLHEVGTFQYPLFEHPPYDSLLASKIVDVAMFENLDVLHVHYAIPHATVAFLANQILASKGKALPVVTTLHGTDITLVGLDRSLSSVVEFGINKSDKVTAVSDSLRKQTQDHFETETDISVIYNFINLERFSRKENPVARANFAPNGEKIIMHISNFRKVKRVDDVVKVFSMVREKTPVKLLFVGDGPERIKVQDTCRSLGICGDIIFLGKQDAVEDLLSLADLFVLPSAKESFGLAALEAMACGVPVISSNAGGLPEVNIHGQTGYLSEVGDIEAMAAGAIDILLDDNKLATFRDNARSKALEFSREKIVPQYEALYQACVDEQGGTMSASRQPCGQNHTV
jgi:N-acetyl-alpha-D-glucosaminyl L-malate synthase BshA